MREHPDGVAVFLTENRSRFTLPDGKAVERDWKAGDARWIPRGSPLAREFSDKLLELVLIELKRK